MFGLKLTHSSLVSGGDSGGDGGGDCGGEMVNMRARWKSTLLHIGKDESVLNGSDLKLQGY